MKSKVLIAGFISLLLLQPVICSQAQSQDGASRDDEDQSQFDQSVNSREPELLFKALWYTDSPRAYQVLELYTTGMSYSRYVITNWSVRGSHAGILNAEQLKEIRRMIAEVRPPEKLPASQEGQKHIAFVHVSDGNYVRYDFVGQSIPNNVERIVEKVEAEMSAAPVLAGKNQRPDPVIIFNPCSKREENDPDLAAMSNEELGAYASRRSLMPLDKYRAIKCYLQRFPDNTDGYIKYMKRWVEKFEKGTG